MYRYLYYKIDLHDLEHISDIIQQKISLFGAEGEDPNVIYLSPYLYHYLIIRYRLTLNDNRLKTLYGLEVRVDNRFEDNKFMLKREVNMNNAIRIGDYTFKDNGFYYVARDNNVSTNTKLPKHSGLSRNKANKYLAELVDEDDIESIKITESLNNLRDFVNNLGSK